MGIKTGAPCQSEYLYPKPKYISKEFSKMQSIKSKRTARMYNQPLKIHTKFGVMTIAEIAKKLGCSIKSVYRHKNKTPGKSFTEIFDLPKFKDIV